MQHQGTQNVTHTTFELSLRAGVGLVSFLKGPGAGISMALWKRVMTAQHLSGTQTGQVHQRAMPAARWERSFPFLSFAHFTQRSDCGLCWHPGAFFSTLFEAGSGKLLPTFYRQNNFYAKDFGLEICIMFSFAAFLHLSLGNTHTFLP